MTIERITVTKAAAEIIHKLTKEHGDLIFHQSGGCCDGTAPMCIKKSEFLIGGRDIFIGEIANTPFYMSPDQYTYFENSHITIDVCSGRGASFSLEIPLGLRFQTVSRLFTPEEKKQLEGSKT